jgi:enoyl-[acyl-carrier-protein] reductase (NADH)
MLDKTLDISAVSFHKMIQSAKKLNAIADYGSIVALSYVAAQRTFYGYNDMADFIKGLNEGANKTSKKDIAYMAGLQIGQQISNQMMKGINQELFGTDSTKTISQKIKFAMFHINLKIRTIFI